MDGEEDQVSFARRQRRRLAGTRYSRARLEFNDSQTNRSLKSKAARKHPAEYAKARARYPTPE